MPILKGMDSPVNVVTYERMMSTTATVLAKSHGSTDALRDTFSCATARNYRILF